VFRISAILVLTAMAGCATSSRGRGDSDSGPADSASTDDGPCVTGEDACAAVGGRCVVHEFGASFATCPPEYGPMVPGLPESVCASTCESAGTMLCCLVARRDGGAEVGPGDDAGVVDGSAE
jgi:hypothetical protein